MCYMHCNKHRFLHYNNIHNYTRRYSENLKILFLGLSHSKNMLNYYGPVFYNKLNDNIKNLSLLKFQNVIKIYLISKTFYSVQFVEASVEMDICFLKKKILILKFSYHNYKSLYFKIFK